MDGRTIEPRYRLRVNITKNTKGYQHETTAEVEWSGSTSIGQELVARLLREADVTARAEIRLREQADADERRALGVVE